MVLRLAFVCMAVFASAAFAQSAGSDDVDFALGLPQKMVVESVDLKNGVLVLDGHRYRVYTGDKVMMVSGPGASLSPEQLVPGMEVLVSTDGTVPSRSHAPYVRGLWSAPVEG